MANAPTAHKGLERINDPDLLEKILTAIAEYDLSSSSDWNDLDALSSHTEFETIEANPEGIFEGPPGSFQAIGTVYVTLNYGDKKDGSSMSDSYPVQLSGKFDRKKQTVSIEHVSVDTSSFSS